MICSHQTIYSTVRCTVEIATHYECQSVFRILKNKKIMVIALIKEHVFLQIICQTSVNTADFNYIIFGKRIYKLKKGA